MMDAMAQGKSLRRRVGLAAAGLTLAAAVALLMADPRLRRAVALSRTEREGDLLFQKGDLAGAEACWRPVLAARPLAESARNKLAVVCIQQDRFEEARALLDDGIRRQPSVTSYHFNLGLLRHMEGDPAGALQALARVEALNPGHGDLHYLKGLAYERLGESGKANAEFVKQLNVDPATPRAWARLGVTGMAVR